MAGRILVPLDGSALGEAALDYVKNLISGFSPQEKTTVVLFHAVTSLARDVDFYIAGHAKVPYSNEEIEQFVEKGREYLGSVSKSIEMTGAEVETHVVSAKDPAEAIIKAEKDYNCDLVAMSTHGRSGLRRWAYGSVTDTVLRGGSVPVLMVRTQEENC